MSAVDENFVIMDEQRKSRASILKVKPPIEAEIGKPECTTITPTNRRVSFAATNFVKQYKDDDLQAWTWDNTYEEPLLSNTEQSSSNEKTLPSEGGYPFISAAEKANNTAGSNLMDLTRCNTKTNRCVDINDRAVTLMDMTSINWRDGEGNEQRTPTQESAMDFTRVLPDSSPHNPQETVKNLIDTDDKENIAAAGLLRIHPKKILVQKHGVDRSHGEPLTICNKKTVCEDADTMDITRISLPQQNLSAEHILLLPNCIKETKTGTLMDLTIPKVIIDAGDSSTAVNLSEMNITCMNKLPKLSSTFIDDTQMLLESAKKQRKTRNYPSDFSVHNGDYKDAPLELDAPCLAHDRSINCANLDAESVSFVSSISFDDEKSNPINNLVDEFNTTTRPSEFPFLNLNLDQLKDKTLTQLPVFKFKSIVSREMILAKHAADEARVREEIAKLPNLKEILPPRSELICVVDAFEGRRRGSIGPETLEEWIIAESEKQSSKWELVVFESSHCVCTILLGSVTIDINYSQESYNVTTVTVHSDYDSEKQHVAPWKHAMRSACARLQMSRLHAALGQVFTLRTLFDYIQLTAEAVLDDFYHVVETLMTCDHQGITYTFDEDFRIVYTLYVLKSAHPAVLSIMIEYDDINKMSKNSIISVTASIGRVNAGAIERLARECPNGRRFLPTFLDNLSSYRNSLDSNFGAN